MADEIIKELWQIKDDLAREHDYDMDSYFTHLLTRKRTGDHRIIDLRAMKKTAEQGHEPDRKV